MNFLGNVFFGTANHPEFLRGVQHAIDHLSVKDGIFSGDNLFTYHRNLSFLGDEKFMSSYSKHATTEIEKCIIWRLAVVAWGAMNGMRLEEGDFVECACYKGTSARIVCDYVDFAQHSDRHYYLYDLFEHDPNMAHHAMPEHSKDLYASVKLRFADVLNVKVIQGSVPEVLAKVAPEKIAFMHLDLNDAAAEIGALEFLFDRMLPGAVLVLDDYGWKAYSKQKIAEDPWFRDRGYQVLELPTGQGLLIK